MMLFLVGTLTILLVLAVLFMAKIISWLSNMVALLGSYLHTLFSLPNPEEKEAWLFSLLISITKWPSIGLGMIWGILTIGTIFLPINWLPAVHNIVNDLFLLVLLVRLLSILAGSVIYGTSLRTIIKSLQS